MACLLLRLEGPMQSWGTTSRADQRDTGREPTKSGVIGLICAAMGRDRFQPIEDLAALRMGVRVDVEGVPRSDFQTAGGGDWKGAPYRILRASGGFSKDAVTSTRHYLSDAVFLVGLEGNQDLLQVSDAALRNPRWLLGLGRKSFPPSNSIFLDGGIKEGSLAEELRCYKLLKDTDPANEEKSLRLILEVDGFEGDPVRDVPLDWKSTNNRVFGTRYVRTEFCTVGKPSEQNPCI